MPVLTIYRLLTIDFAFFASAVLSWRARQGKEDPERFGERMGAPGLERPAGRLVWLHGAKLFGESLALLPLVERFIQRGVEVLVTTGTVSSAKVLRAGFRRRTHQLLPLDAPQFVEQFLEHWRPDIVLFAESELWPNMIRAIHARRLPLVLVNATISRRSAARWRRLPAARERCSARSTSASRRTPRARRAISASARRACASAAI